MKFLRASRNRTEQNSSDLLSFIRTVTNEVQTWPAWKRIEYINDYSENDEPRMSDEE